MTKTKAASSNRLSAPEPIAALNRVKCHESDEALVDIREACPGVETLERVCPYLRATVAGMLQNASGRLPADRRFRVGTALRTLEHQRRHWDGYRDRLRAEHPGWSRATLHRAVNRFFAPYNQPAPPGHCTGAAVDVQLVDAEGVPLDVTSPLEHWAAAPTWTTRISEEARRNRMVMVGAMLDAGFSNCRDEFWHYSWGDAAWAVRTGAGECPYGLAAPPVSVEPAAWRATVPAARLRPDGIWELYPQDGDATVAIRWSAGLTLRLSSTDPSGVVLESSADRETWTAVGHLHPGATAELHPESDTLYVRTTRR